MILSSLPAHEMGRKTLTHPGSTNRGQAKRLRRGETPIEFPAEYLPDDVRPPSTSGAFADIAMLAADGALSFRAETSRDWLRENDLL
jgi:hypothetical protein